VYDNFMPVVTESSLGPTSISVAEMDVLLRLASGEARAYVHEASGHQVDFPENLISVLTHIAKAMQQDDELLLMKRHRVMTTQEAADFVGVSRQYMVRLMDSGVIPCERTGKHRRVRLSEIVAYQQHRAATGKAAMDSMTDMMVEAGVYDHFYDPTSPE
jgi:excisionase family DNA binding protein